MIFTEKYQSEIGGYKRRIDTSNFADGIYLLKIMTEDEIIEKKITISK